MVNELNYSLIYAEVRWVEAYNIIVLKINFSFPEN